MKKICVGLCGLTCSGKDTVANIFAKHGFKKYSYTEKVLAPVAKSKNLPHTRDAYRVLLQKLGRKADELLFEEILKEKGTKIIIPNIRTSSALDFWRNKKDFKFYLVKLDADYKIRYKRYLSRKREIDPMVSKEDFNGVDEKDKKVNDLGKIINHEKFDFEISNNGDLQELGGKCIMIIKTL
ncbi:MAG: AAA family ATPase [Candidatus Aenigmarchaeota archaeon]|nr:AAA family ATPase [Candidatus Aenigmarchaeota archaeon]